MNGWLNNNLRPHWNSRSNNFSVVNKKSEQIRSQTFRSSVRFHFSTNLSKSCNVIETHTLMQSSDFTNSRSNQKTPGSATSIWNGFHERWTNKWVMLVGLKYHFCRVS
jgi:hypothetical protein